MGEPSELGAMLRGALPGVANGRIVALSVGAAAVCVVLASLAADTPNLRTRGALLVGAAAVWAHAAGWLTTGELRGITGTLTDLAGAAWTVFLVVFGAGASATWLLAHLLEGAPA